MDEGGRTDDKERTGIRMVIFVNAKINIGLQVTRKRDDGYHELSTVFYPVGLYAGTPENPESFCDVLEIIPRKEPGFGVTLQGRDCGCEPEKNLVWRAAESYFREFATQGFGASIILEKYLPSGAGLGGGSADASLLLKGLRQVEYENHEIGEIPDDRALASEALKLGADCPFFIYNRPMYATGLGERLYNINLNLSGYYCVIVKPAFSIPTREAFADIRPESGNFDLTKIAGLPVKDWQGKVCNDFEKSLFPLYPELPHIKEKLIQFGAEYASMSGSGSSIYGLFPDMESALRARTEFAGKATIEGSYLLKM